MVRISHGSGHMNKALLAISFIFTFTSALAADICLERRDARPSSAETKSLASFSRQLRKVRTQGLDSETHNAAVDILTRKFSKTLANPLLKDAINQLLLEDQLSLLIAAEARSNPELEDMSEILFQQLTNLSRQTFFGYQDLERATLGFTRALENHFLRSAKTADSQEQILDLETRKNQILMTLTQVLDRAVKQNQAQRAWSAVDKGEWSAFISNNFKTSLGLGLTIGSFYVSGPLVASGLPVFAIGCGMGLVGGGGYRLMMIGLEDAKSAWARSSSRGTSYSCELEVAEAKAQNIFARIGKAAAVGGATGCLLIPGVKYATKFTPRLAQGAVAGLAVYKAYEVYKKLREAKIHWMIAKTLKGEDAVEEIEKAKELLGEAGISTIDAGLALFLVAHIQHGLHGAELDRTVELVDDAFQKEIMTLMVQVSDNVGTAAYLGFEAVTK